MNAFVATGAICSTCYDRTHRTPCTRCGESCRPYEVGLCTRCVLEDRLSQLFGEPSEGGRLEPLREALLEVPEPRSMLGWIRRPRVRDLLLQISAGELELSHEAFDQHERSRQLDHLRELLVAIDLLPKHNPRIDRLAPWLEEVLADASARHALIIRPFATWSVLRRVRWKADRKRDTEGGAKWARSRIRAALQLLEWLQQRGVELEDLSQVDIDLWLSTGPTTRYVARDFIAWCRARRFVGDIRFPLRQPTSPSEVMADGERWELVERLLRSDVLAREIRVAGLFALLFGQHLSRVCHMRVADLRVEGGTVFARFGRDDLALPPILKELALELRKVRGHAAIGNNGEWLFPGGLPGRPITAERMRLRLADEGIVLRPTRNSALLALAPRVPTPVIADLLGLHINTAVEWSRRAGGDWAAYAVSRAPGPTEDE